MRLIYPTCFLVGAGFGARLPEGCSGRSRALDRAVSGHLALRVSLVRQPVYQPLPSCAALRRQRLALHRRLPGLVLPMAAGSGQRMRQALVQKAQLEPPGSLESQHPLPSASSRPYRDGGR